ncbi:MAG: hypothetical protein RLZZ385_2304, partial [Pseudomonadota bacterium]
QPGGYSQSGNTNLFPERMAIGERFSKHLTRAFDMLTGESSASKGILDYGSLSLVEEEDLEAMIALEGMVDHARNTDISEYLSFTTRINTLFYGVVIDESNNPLDPEQIGEAFRDAMRPIKLDAKSLLIVYRKFNTCVFHELEEVLEQANDILIEHGVIPNLDMAARNKKLQQRKRSLDRPTANAAERAFQTKDEEARVSRTQSAEMLSMLRALMHSAAGSLTAASQPAAGAAAVGSVAIAGMGLPGQYLMPAGLASGMMVGDNKVQLVPQDRLFGLLSELQAGLGGGTSNLDLTRSLGEKLKEGETAGTLQAIDGQSSDIINLVSLLFKAIWADPALPIPIKELIGRLQITIVKVALQDPQLFNDDQHPVRVLMNELSMAGIGWTEVEKLETDPVYSMMRDLVSRAVNDYQGDLALFETLLAEFRAFKKQQLTGSARIEQTLLQSDERHQRLEEINDYVRQKISERILDERLDPLVDKLLKTHLQRFLVKLVLREGPGGPGWKPVINTIDVLLWTVQTHKQEGDRERYEKINPRLLTNLGKALRIAGLAQTATDKALADLRKIQLASFDAAEEADAAAAAESEFAAMLGEESAAVSTAKPRPTELPPLPDDDAHLKQVDQLPVGIWVEFSGGDEPGIRCTLAARIDTIDKFVFVNRQGVKVVEKSRMGLARELKQGTVKLISDGPLFERALESVFSTLRDNRTPTASQEQQ